LEDYNPGDKSIIIEGKEEAISKFPATGIITLTEQCSEIDKRAISLYYGSRTSFSFNNLELLPEFKDVIKPKKITNVTMNVLNKHHNHLKDSLIAVEKFLGVKGQKDQVPFGETITGRTNFLKSLVYKPRAWFTITNAIGIYPLEVFFIEDSFREGDDKVNYVWKIRVHNKDQEVSWTIIHPEQDKDNEKKYKYIFNEPEVFDVSLTVKNKYGEDTVTFEKAIISKIEAPKEAIINLIPKTSQNYKEGIPIGGPYTTPPKIRSTTNTFIDIEVKNAPNLGSTDPSVYSFAGELLDESNKSIDPIIEYTWRLGDELNHTNSNYTKASYNIGGYYDLILRVDTKFGSYRITRYENSIDIVENQNLWLFNINQSNSNGSGILETWEFGLKSEVFKLLGNQTITLDRNNSFLDSYNDSNYATTTEQKAKKEFFKNVEFAQQGTLSSGDRGNSLLFWSSGGLVLEDQEIKIKRYNAFNDTYTSLSSIQNKPWNWASLVSQDTVYFILGQYKETSLNSNFANPIRTNYEKSSAAVSSTSLEISNFENGAEELLNNPSYYNEDGIPTNGYFSIYKTAWKDSTGYILRNSSVNEFFRISDFYKTNGNLSTPFNTITKLPDMSGMAKTEGELVALSNGIFFFNNSGEISAWNDVSLVWETGRENSSSTSFRSLQDSNESGFDNKSNSLLAASDGDNIAYLSYDYSNKTFIKFNSIDLTFSSAGNKVRPNGKQLKMGIY
jgi:PKD repeat protein